jgi:hypothetical protein
MFWIARYHHMHGSREWDTNMVCHMGRLNGRPMGGAKKIEPKTGQWNWCTGNVDIQTNPS